MVKALLRFFAKIFFKDSVNIIVKSFKLIITPWSFLDYIIATDFKFGKIYNSQNVCQWMLLILIIPGMQFN